MAPHSLIDASAKCDGRRSPARRAAVAERNSQVKRKYPKGFDSKSRLYRIWRAMQSRCHVSSHEAHERYAGRGIFVCVEWRADYGAFLRWALANGYSDELTIDRKDNDRGYEPDNCRWLSMEAQQNNRRDNVVVSAFGETKTAKEWTRDPRCAVGYVGLLGRLYRGECAEEAISRPSRCLNAPKPVRLTVFGETKSAEEWASDPRCKVALATLYWRHKRGWPHERAVTLPARVRTDPGATHCARGHEFTEENIYRSSSGHRRCRKCLQEKERRRSRLK